MDLLVVVIALRSIALSNRKNIFVLTWPLYEACVTRGAGASFTAVLGRACLYWSHLNDDLKVTLVE